MTNENIQPLLEAEENPYKVKLDENIVISTDIGDDESPKGTLKITASTKSKTYDGTPLVGEYTYELIPDPGNVTPLFEGTVGSINQVGSISALGSIHPVDNPSGNFYVKDWTIETVDGTLTIKTPEPI